MESADLSDTFWNVGLPQLLETSSVTIPYFNVYTAAQICRKETSMLSANISIENLLSAGDVHHIFPKGYLKQCGITDKTQYNQVANYVYLDTSINIAIGKQAPNEYFPKARKTARGEPFPDKEIIGTLTCEQDFWNSLAVNSVPSNVVEMTAENYPEFLNERRKLMALKIKDYYYSL
jgi:hypothetical protein